jgi:HD-GYP domain-containing protein (c-di-GMP phosphodiesterase class II)
MRSRGSAFALVLAIAAGLMLVYSIPEFVAALSADFFGLLIWFSLLVVAGILTYASLQSGGGVIGTAVVNFAIIITYGGTVAAWVGAIEMLILMKFFLRFSMLRSVFNVSQMVISLFLAGMVYRLAGGAPLAGSGWTLSWGLGLILPVVLCHLTYFSVNTGLVTMWSSLNLKRVPVTAWRANYLYLLPQSFAAPVVGTTLAFLYSGFSTLLVVVFFLWLVYYTRSSKVNLDLLNSQRETVAALASTVDSATPYMGGESERVAGLAVELSKRVGLSGWRVQALEYAALLHDIGYLSLAKRSLLKSEPLAPVEWTEVRRHAGIGADIIGRVRSLERVSEIVRAHHERPDGRGYPRGLRQNEIPREARILKVADAFVAMTSERPYREAMKIDRAVGKIVKGANTRFDEEAVKGLVDLYGVSLLGQFVSYPLQEAA